MRENLHLYVPTEIALLYTASGCIWADRRHSSKTVLTEWSGYICLPRATWLSRRQYGMAH